MNKQTTIVGAFVVVLALLYFTTQTGTVDTKSIDPDLFIFDSHNLSSVNVNTPQMELNFKFTQSIWELNNYPVDTSRFNNFIETMSTLVVDRKISSKSEKQTKFELDDQATSIEFLSGETSQLDILIGKGGANYLETFVRAAGSDDIYAVKASLGQYKTFDPKEFWDRTITHLNVDEVQSVKFSGDISYQLDRNGPVWTFDGAQVDLQKVTDMIRPLENMKANGFSEVSLQNHEVVQSIVIDMEAGESIALDFFNKDENATALLVRASTHNKIFEYPKSGLNRFKKELADLIADPIPAE